MRSVRWSADLRSWSCTAAGGGLAAASQSRCGSGGCQSSHSDKVVGGGDQVSSQSSPLQAAVARPSEATYRFHPSEDLFDALTDALTDGVSDVPRGAAVDGTPPSAGVLRHVRCDLPLSQIGNAGFGVIALVGAQRLQTDTALARLSAQRSHGCPSARA